MTEVIPVVKKSRIGIEVGSGASEKCDDEMAEAQVKPMECDESSSVSKVHLPQKKYYRQRAHSNPICDHIFD